MSFTLKWVDTASTTYNDLRDRAKTAQANREKNKVAKASPQEGLFKQVDKTLKFLKQNPRHPGLQTHAYDSLVHPWSPGKEKVFEAYAQNNTPGAYRVFWCYGPKAKEITIIAITEHP
ncbi:MAG: hypothetical protein AB7F86_02170 [Bdellovibrionales bacterium]